MAQAAASDTDLLPLLIWKLKQEAYRHLLMNVGGLHKHSLVVAVVIQDPFLFSTVSQARQLLIIAAALPVPI
jgi:hypothetical protein